jgi:hypothetical protein
MKEYDLTHAVVVVTIVFVGLCHTSMVAVDTPSKSTNGVNVTDVDVLLMCIPIKRKSKFLLQKKTPTELAGVSQTIKLNLIKPQERE